MELCHTLTHFLSSQPFGGMDVVRIVSKTMPVLAHPWNYCVFSLKVFHVVSVR
jgi:hypothetical protein